MERIKNFLKKEIIYIPICFFAVFIITFFITQFFNKGDTFFFKLLKILFSWPLMGSFIFLIFFYKFSEDIKQFLRTNKLTGAAGVSFSGVDQLPEGNNRISNENDEKKSGSDELSLKEKAESLEKKLEETEENNTTLQQLLAIQNKISENNEFSYLSLFFVDNTKRILKWFFDHKGRDIVTKISYDIFCSVIVTATDQREIIFQILVNNGMIDGVVGGAYSITEKGERFLKFIRFI